MTIQTSTLQQAMENLRIPAYGGAGVVTLRMETLKRAYHERVMQSHPDRAETLGLARDILEGEFKRVNQSYQTLLEFLKSREKVLQTRKINPRQAETRANQSFFYRGKIPQRKLRFGEYLYYSGLVDWNTFIHALVWQMQNRPRFGEIALQLGYLKRDDLNEIIRAKSVRERFGDAALRLGHITDHQRFVVLGRQRVFGKPVGRYFSERCHFGPEFLKKKLDEHARHNSMYP